jgi:hypothetical protein
VKIRLLQGLQIFYKKEKLFILIWKIENLCSKESLEEINIRFWSKVDVLENNDNCWNWIASIDSPGYGSFKINGKKVNSHRMAYFLTFGEIPEELCVCHKCDNKLCCNPHHLWLGTRHENNTDMKSKGRCATGDRSGARIHPESVLRGDMRPNRKLSEFQVKNILNLYFNGKVSAIHIAEQYNVSRSAIFKVVSGVSWNYLFKEFLN